LPAAPDTLARLAGQTGMQYNDLLGDLSQALPRFVDALTLDGRLMSDAEAEQRSELRPLRACAAVSGSLEAVSRAVLRRKFFCARLCARCVVAKMRNRRL
jgi:YidB-like protein